MRYASIRKMDISNGPGIRVSLFTQGCNIRCEGCFNKEAWDYEGGKEWTEETKEFFLDLCDKPQIEGISILGGEPLSPPNYEALIDLIDSFRERFPDKTVWLWTGKVFEEITAWSVELDLIKRLDVLVDGPWKIDLGDFSLKYRGSKNQRVININKSLKENKVAQLLY